MSEFKRGDRVRVEYEAEYAYEYGDNETHYVSAGGYNPIVPKGAKITKLAPAEPPIGTFVRTNEGFDYYRFRDGWALLSAGQKRGGLPPRAWREVSDRGANHVTKGDPIR